jgi:hypothetical protein
VVGGSKHFLSAYRRFFDNPESHLFPTDYAPSPAHAAVAAAAQRGSAGVEAPSVLAEPPPTFQSTTQRTHTEFPPEFLYQHPVRAFTSSALSTLTQDRCYRTAPAQGLPVPRDCSLGDKFAYIRDGTGGYIVAETSVNQLQSNTSKDPTQQHDHMFGAVQVLEDDSCQLRSPSGGHAQPRRWQSLPPVASGFVTTNAAAYQEPSVALQQLNETAQQRTAALVLDGSMPRKRELAFTLPGIFHRVNGIPTIVREKEVMYQMRVAKGQIRTPPRAKITSISLEHEPLSVPVPRE